MVEAYKKDYLFKIIFSFFFFFTKSIESFDFVISLLYHCVTQLRNEGVTLLRFDEAFSSAPNYHVLRVPVAGPRKANIPEFTAVRNTYESVISPSRDDFQRCSFIMHRHADAIPRCGE